MRSLSPAESEGPTKGKQNEGSRRPTLRRLSSGWCSSKSTASCGTEPIDTAGMRSVVPCKDTLSWNGVKKGVAVIVCAWLSFRKVWWLVEGSCPNVLAKTPLSRVQRSVRVEAKSAGCYTGTIYSSSKIWTWCWSFDGFVTERKPRRCALRKLCVSVRSQDPITPHYTCQFRAAEHALSILRASIPTNTDLLSNSYSLIPLDLSRHKDTITHSFALLASRRGKGAQYSSQ